MRLMAKHMGFPMAMLYLLLMGIYSQGGLLSLNGSGLAVDVQITNDSFKAAFDHPFYGLQPQVNLTELPAPSPASVKPVPKDYSVFSWWANYAATKKITDYIYHSSIIVVQPQLFDMLFPFHYFS
jgi:hypothetical protein